MGETEIQQFEASVERAFCENGIRPGENCMRLGAAVSGGADSVSLLVALCHILKKQGLPLFVLTVNHSIRAEAESNGDADFVRSVCAELCSRGVMAECSVRTLRRGQVADVARVRGGGTEEAARFLRYGLFEEFIAEKKLDYLCLAHNQNDQLETLLMRFLQGGGTEAQCGIRPLRGPFFRPLLDVPRPQIEAYLLRRGFSWRTDSSNADTDFLRNKIRHVLMPVLDEQFPGWRTAALNGMERSRTEYSALQELSGGVILQENEGGVSFLAQEFRSRPEAVRHHLLLQALNRLGVNGRIPRAFLKDADGMLMKNVRGKKKIGTAEILLKKNTVFIKKSAENATDFVFFDIIREEGTYEFPFGTLTARPQQDGLFSLELNGNALLQDIRLPLCVRSPETGDEIACADGSHKKVRDVLSDWQADEEQRRLLPVIQRLDTPAQEIICIPGRFLGFNDWIVK